MKSLHLFVALAALGASKKRQDGSEPASGPFDAAAALAAAADAALAAAPAEPLPPGTPELPASATPSAAMKGLRGGPVVLYFYPKDDTP